MNKRDDLIPLSNIIPLGNRRDVNAAVLSELLSLQHDIAVLVDAIVKGGDDNDE